MQQFKWTSTRPTKGLSFPTSREGATLTYIPTHQQLILFGGISNGRMNDIMIFDIQNNQWKTQQTQGRQPSPRCYHTSFYDEQQDIIYFYGGQGDKGRSMPDFYCLLLSNYIWKRLYFIESPPNRHSHSINDLANQEKIIFGGACWPEDVLFNDVWIFKYGAVEFTSNQQELPGAECFKKVCKGELPTPRAGHGAVIYQNHLYAIGGKCQDQITSVYKLNLETFVWKKILHFGKAPSSRAFFTAHLINDNVIIFGGQDLAANKVLNETYVFNLNDYNWSAPFTAGNIPSARYNYCSCLIQDIICIMGGINQTYCGMDLYFLNLGTVTENIEWEQIQQPTVEEKQVIETANSMIMEMKMHMQNIEDAMMRERTLMSDLQKEVEHLQNEHDHLEQYIKQKRKEIEKEHRDAFINNKNKETVIETIFLMIKQEQMMTRQILIKNRLIEECLQNQYNLIYVLDQFYQSIRKIQGTDPMDLKVRKFADQFYGDIQRAKEQQIEALQNIKYTYQKYEILSKKNQQELTEQRGSVRDMNQEFEQLIFETEHD